jgi:hypothetical protein
MQEQDREAMYDNVGNHLLVGRVGEACEIALAYLFLMQEGYSTGQTVVGSEQATKTLRVAEGQTEELETSVNGL